MIKRIFTLCLISSAAALLAFEPSVDLSHGKLKVSDDSRYLVFEDGTPFFWLGDTAWELFHRTTREEAEFYLKNRAEKGFTVIQAVVLAELDGLNTGNAYGDRPLIGDDPARPNEAYFAHVDYIVRRARDLGIFIGMLPTWGDKFNRKWGVGPEVFTPENAYTYGLFLGERYKEEPVIWILGGDRTCDNNEDLEITRAMARGLGDGDGGAHLKTYHPQGGHSSSEWFHNDAWLDLNMFQSGHGEINNANYRMAEHNHNLKPVKPVLDGEPNYEDHPINWRPQNGWFDEFDSRRAGYWSMLSGACGHTYGNHNIWQMWLPGRTPVSSARTPWIQSIDYPGAFQAGIMRRFFEAYPWQSLVPAPSWLRSGPNTGGREIRVAAAANGTLVFAYSPYGTSFTLDLSAVKGEKIKTHWFNPRNGTTVTVGTAEKTELMAFDPPADEKRGNDWVLVLKTM